MIRNSSGPSVMSISTARPSTIPKPPPIPCSTRSTSSTSTEGASAQPIEASRHSMMPISSGPRRPRRSERGPATICPLAVPRKNAVIVSCIREAVVPSCSATSGKAGMYMSVASGPMALSVVSTRITIAVTLERVRRSSSSSGRCAMSVSAGSSSTGIAPVMVGIDPVIVGREPVVGAGSCGVRSWDCSGGVSSAAVATVLLSGVQTTSRAGPEGPRPARSDHLRSAAAARTATRGRRPRGPRR